MKKNFLNCSETSTDIKELTKQIDLRKKQLDRNKIMLEKKLLVHLFMMKS